MIIIYENARKKQWKISGHLLWVESRIWYGIVLDSEYNSC